MIPGVGGTQTLPRRVGMARALDLVLAGGVLDARAAQTAGIVHRVVPRRRLAPAALALARRLARLDPQLVVAVRRCARAAQDLDLGAAIAFEGRLARGGTA
jgi:enoyl-CoA hydratase/carnithine racemase